MKYLLFVVSLAVASSLLAQKKSVTLDDLVVNRTFKAKEVPNMVSTDDGLSYTTIEEGNKIVKYAYASGKKEAVVVDLKKIEKCPISSFEGYIFNKQGNKVLLYTDVEKIYRYSYKANYYVLDVVQKEIVALSDSGKQMVPSFSPDGEMIAYIRDNNIYLRKLRFATESAITKDGEMNAVLNGIPDWVYEEEFKYNKAYDWSPGSTEIAYVRFDETAVKDYSFPLYKGSNPSKDEFSLYPGQYTFKYPKAGGQNAKVSVRAFNIKTRVTKTMDLGVSDEAYIPRIKYTTEDSKLGIVVMNRHQSQLDLYLANTGSGVCHSVFTQRNERYIEEDVLDNIQFLSDGSGFTYVGELDGYNHIHVFSMAGATLSQVTKGKFDVTKFYGYDASSKMFYYQAAVTSPTQREIYRTSLDGKKTEKLSKEAGTTDAQFNNTFSYYLSTYSTLSSPDVVTLCDAKGKVVKVVEDNAALKKSLANYNISKKELFSFVSSEGVSLNGWMVKPLDFDAEKQYPVVMLQYSGPNSQEVLDQWGMGWEFYLASKGYLVACVDPRGTGARGEEFRKSTYMKLGALEVKDQVETAMYLGQLAYVDASRIGIWGWSYGGYISALCLSQSNVFKLGIAVAPITDWRFYDTAYTERYLRRPQENKRGYEENSPINLVESLQGRLFLIHGTADDNVHYQNTLEYADRLIQAGKQFDMFTYPNRNHNLRGGNVRHHLYQMKSDYIFKNL